MSFTMSIQSLMVKAVLDVTKHCGCHSDVRKILDIYVKFSNPMCNQYNYTSLLNEILMLNKSLSAIYTIIPLQRFNTHNDKYIATAEIVYNNKVYPLSCNIPFFDKKSCSDNISRLIIKEISSLLPKVTYPKWYSPDVFNMTLSEIIEKFDSFTVKQHVRTTSESDNPESP